MISIFDGEFAFLSNFHTSPITDEDGIVYPTVEHYFQAMKSLDKSERFNIAIQPTPGKAKRCGRRVALRSDWEQIKEDVMYEALQKKFADDLLKEKLLATGDEWLEEGNTWHDNYWGICHCIDCQDKMGKNKLGQLLMKLRKELRGRPMKWHVYGPDHEPLCWDGQALEFDTNMDAREFLASAISNSVWSEDFWVDAEIEEDILYYDGGYINATELLVGWDDENCEEILISK